RGSDWGPVERGPHRPGTSCKDTSRASTTEDERLDRKSSCFGIASSSSLSPFLRTLTADAMTGAIGAGSRSAGPLIESQREEGGYGALRSVKKQSPFCARGTDPADTRTLDGRTRRRTSTSGGGRARSLGRADRGKRPRGPNGSLRGSCAPPQPEGPS